MPLTVEHDLDANAVYVHLADLPYAYGEDLDRERRIDYAEDGTPIGVEFTCVSGGVELEALPRAQEIASALGRLDIRVYA